MNHARKTLFCLACLLSSLALRTAIADENEQPPEQKPKIDILLIKAHEPTEYTMENRSFVGGLINTFRNNSLGNNLSLDMMRQKPKLSDMINEGVDTALAGHNLAHAPAPKVQINFEKPWKLDYATLAATGKPVLFVYVESIGVRSRNMDSTYRPFSYVVGCLITPKYKNDCTYMWRSRFGDGGDRDYDDHGIVGNLPEEKWRSANEAYENIPEIIASYRRSLPKMIPWIIKSAAEQMETPDFKKIYN